MRFQFSLSCSIGLCLLVVQPAFADNSRLPPTRLDSFVYQAGAMAESIYGDEGCCSLPPLNGFQKCNRINAGIFGVRDQGLTTGHGSFMPDAWGADEFISPPGEWSQSGANGGQPIFNNGSLQANTQAANTTAAATGAALTITIGGSSSINLPMVDQTALETNNDNGATDQSNFDLGANVGNMGNMGNVGIVMDTRQTRESQPIDPDPQHSGIYNSHTGALMGFADGGTMEEWCLGLKGTILPGHKGEAMVIYYQLHPELAPASPSPMDW